MTFLVKMSGQPSSYVQRSRDLKFRRFGTILPFFVPKNGTSTESMYCTCTCCNFQAIILLLLSCNHTNYYQQAIPIQSLAYINTTYNQQVLTLQLVCYTYTNYNLQAITFQPTHYTYTTYNLK